MRRFALIPDLADFEGDWQLSRVITDHKAHNTGRFDGHAYFSQSDTGLLYVETGQLRLGAQPPVEAERRYLWRSSNGGIDIRFHDGRPFHWIDPRLPTATHWCKPDTYRVAYFFGNWPEWQSVWTATGPRKDYYMVNSYSRRDN